MANKIYAGLYSTLRKMGFKRDYAYSDVVEYSQEFPEWESKVTVQIWIDHPSKDYKHRTSHYHKGYTPYGVMDTRPTDWKTVEGMVKSIEFEKTRWKNKVNPKMHKWFDPEGEEILGDD